MVLAYNSTDREYFFDKVTIVDAMDYLPKSTQIRVVNIILESPQGEEISLKITHNHYVLVYNEEKRS